MRRPCLLPQHQPLRVWVTKAGLAPELAVHSPALECCRVFSVDPFLVLTTITEAPP